MGETNATDSPANISPRRAMTLFFIHQTGFKTHRNHNNIQKWQHKSMGGHRAAASGKMPV
jgi:hypothetical protein